jgi:hypothetical protein
VAKVVSSRAAPLRRSIGEIKAKINPEASLRKTPFDSLLIGVIRDKSFFKHKNRCGPGPANPGRIACGRLAALSPHHAVRRLSKQRSRRNARFWARSPSRDSADEVRVPWLAVIAQADGSILPVGRIFEEAATPGCPQNAPLGLLPDTF